ncbi:hypothetical protein HPB52_017986 [Rhipicephalus sanguineus]|uniref:Uncharacterized protein n=1 Tax=Rhipicephalus sanguineus TaxID=34632 RepID=A0A9D4TB61_RHISA|nr:hypothetical protein HPB52_017986 [Rhipicephalus sanguineus]
MRHCASVPQEGPRRRFFPNTEKWGLGPQRDVSPADRTSALGLAPTAQTHALGRGGKPGLRPPFDTADFPNLVPYFTIWQRCREGRTVEGRTPEEGARARGARGALHVSARWCAQQRGGRQEEESLPRGSALWRRHRPRQSRSDCRAVACVASSRSAGVVAQRIRSGRSGRAAACANEDPCPSTSTVEPALCYAPAAAPWTLPERVREPLSVQVCHDQGRWTPWEAVLFPRRAELPLAAAGRDGAERPRSGSAVLRAERRRTSPSATASAGEHGAETLDLSPAASGAGRKRDVNGAAVMAVARAAGQPPPASSPVYAGRFSVASRAMVTGGPDGLFSAVGGRCEKAGQR